MITTHSMSPRASRWWALALLCALPSCSSLQSFAPREQATGEAPNGYPAAEYALVANDDPYGDVRVWCEGAWNDEADNGDPLLVLRLGFEVENRSQAELWIEEAALAVSGVVDGGGSPVPLRVVDGFGISKVRPGASGVIRFDLEAETDRRARTIDEFQVGWALRDEAGVLFEQSTPFRAWSPPRSSFGFGPYYGFWGDGFGYSSGLWWGLHFQSVRVCR